MTRFPARGGVIENNPFVVSSGVAEVAVLSQPQQMAKSPLVIEPDSSGRYGTMIGGLDAFYKRPTDEKE
ncbi:hypothetical protein QWJ07_30945 [Frankia sp. RB7]|nr:hypothetical protein [Frankia sp. RB7]